MKNLNNLFSILLILGMIACTNNPDMNPETGCADVEIVNSVNSSTNGRSLTIQSAEIDGNDLKIEVSYNCGCGNSNFSLESQAGFSKSIPVQTGVSLVLKGKDYCKALCTTDLCFKLDELKGLFQETFSNDYPVLEINLEGLDERLSLDI